MKKDAYWNAFWSRLPRGAAPLEGSGWLSDKPRHQVVKAVDSRWLSAPAKVLDVGCGVGNTAAWLAERGFAVIGMDLSEEAIARASVRCAHVTWIIGDCTSPRDFGPFDVILDCGTVHQLDQHDRLAYVDNLRSWTKPGSRLFLLMRYGEPLFGSTTRESLIEQVNALFAFCFEIRHIEDVDMDEANREPRPGLEIRLERVAGAPRQ